MHFPVGEKKPPEGSDTDDDEGESAEEDSKPSADPESTTPSEQSREIVTQDEKKDEDDEDELPWQVIALLDPSVLDDLRFSSACRDAKVERALMGLDVEQPPESTLGGFLEAERRALKAADMIIEGNDSEAEARGWLYRVTEGNGVKLFCAPFQVDAGGISAQSFDTGERKAVGYRHKGDYFRVMEIRGQWLRLASAERPLRDPPLCMGDAVLVTSGHYKGECGTINKELNPETREFGVSLTGYSGTGHIHVAELKRSGPIPGSIEEKRVARQKKAVKDRARADRRRRREVKESELELRRQRHGFGLYDDIMFDVGSESESGDTEDEAETLAASLFGEIDSESTVSEEEERGYETSYDGPLWVSSTANCNRNEIPSSSLMPVVELVPESAEASLNIGVEKVDADLFDRPFEPRIEGGEQYSEKASDNLGTDGEANSDICTIDASISSNVLKSPLNAVVSVPRLAKMSMLHSKEPEEEEADLSRKNEVYVGSLVTLYGLKNAHQYNGMIGTVITRRNAINRHGVRLEYTSDEEERTNHEELMNAKLLLLKPENMTTVNKSGAVCIYGETMDTDGRMERAARVMNISLDSIGLGAEAVHQNSSRQILDSFLRALDRDYEPHKSLSSSKSSQQMRSDALEEAREAHSFLVDATKTRMSNKENYEAPIFHRVAPHVAVENGFLGKRAKYAAVAAADTSNLNEIERGLASLQVILADEQARLFRHRGNGRRIGSTIASWQLEEAEKDAASMGDLVDDCLLLRLVIVRSLMRCRKGEDALQHAEATVKIFPQSASALLWHGRCLLRCGLRTEGIQSLSGCVNNCAPSVGLGAEWAHIEGTKRLRSIRRTLWCEVRAKDAYERGDFSKAAKWFGEMIEEYNNHASDDKWGRAEALCARAACHRRERNLNYAIVDCEAALSLFPRYSRALFRRAVCLLEAARPDDAKAAFEQLLRVDRNWPNLLDWLVRVEAQSRRQKANTGTPCENIEEEGLRSYDDKDYYSILAVTTDATDAQLKRAYRLKSLKTHPDKKGGSAAAFQLVATAYEILSDPQKRELYNDGVDMSKKKKEKGLYDDSSESEDEGGNKKPLREEVERKYFPENYKFWPFGDPFINKRRNETRKRRQMEREKERAAHMRGGAKRHPWRQHQNYGWDNWDI